MNVTTEEIRSIKPGTMKAFVCEDSPALYTASALVSRLKRLGLPDGVANYETQKFFAEKPNEHVILIRAMREGDEPILNR